jgi:hypothetical protein
LTPEKGRQVRADDQGGAAEAPATGPQEGLTLLDLREQAVPAWWWIPAADLHDQPRTDGLGVSRRLVEQFDMSSNAGSPGSHGGDAQGAVDV